MRGIVGATVLFSAAFVGVAAAEDAYRLAEGDQLRLVLPGAPDFAGLYRLGVDGRIALPLDETVQLGGMTLDEARAAIRTALSSAIQQPAIGVEIAERRPFFIMGDVADSGAYPAEAGLTLGKALAVAGGARRTMNDELQATVVSVRADEEFARSLFDLAEARIRAARLEAAIDGRKEFESPAPPPGLDEDKIAAIEGRERAIQEASIDAYESRMVLLQRLLQTRIDEIDALQTRLETIAEHSRRLDKDIAEVEDLRARGLSTMDRLQSLTREKDRTQSDVLQTNVMLNQAREERVRIEIDLDETPRTRRIDLLNGLSEARARIRQLEGSVNASAQLLDASAGGAAASDLVQLAFTITRGDQRLENVFDLGTPVQAGDLIEVRRSVTAALLGQ
jgi:protein involved in polysaccharide export with SLBB domain